MDLHAVSFDTGIGVHTYCAEWGMVTCCVLQAGLLTSLRQKSLTSTGSPLREEWLTSLCGVAAVTQTWQLQNELVSTLWSPLWAPLGHQAHGPIYDFGSNHDWEHLRIGHGWYDQQQHIFIVVFDPWDLEVSLHNPEVWDGGTPCPL